MRTKHHMAIDLKGFLHAYRRKKINIMEDDDGNIVSDKAARAHIQSLLDQGHKLMCCSNECEGFDPFEKGCPGHPYTEEEEET